MIYAPVQIVTQSKSPHGENIMFKDFVIDPNKNDGTSDTFILASVDGEFLEYQYTADNLDLFTGYTIKIVMSGTNQAYPPRLKELRTIAIR